MATIHFGGGLSLFHTVSESNSNEPRSTRYRVSRLKYTLLPSTDKKDILLMRMLSSKSAWSSWLCWQRTNAAVHTTMFRVTIMIITHLINPFTSSFIMPSCVVLVEHYRTSHGLTTSLVNNKECLFRFLEPCLDG